MSYNHYYTTVAERKAIKTMGKTYTAKDCQTPAQVKEAITAIYAAMGYSFPVHSCEWYDIVRNILEELPKTNTAVTIGRELTFKAIRKFDLSDGAQGRQTELQEARESKRISYGRITQTDSCPVKFTDSRRSYRSKMAERKTNGGNITTMVDGSNPSDYVVYSIDHDGNSTTGYKPVHIPATIWPVKTFIAMLESVNAIKARNVHGVRAGWQIQMCSRRLWDALTDENAIPFDSERIYSKDDFDALREVWGE